MGLLTADAAAAWRSAIQRVKALDYADDPALWAWDRLGVHLWSKQIEIAVALCHHRRVAVRSSHGIGKSFLAAVIAQWWIDTHPPGTAIVISSAPSYQQVHGVLWENIRGLHRKSGKMRGVVQRSDQWLDDDGTQLGFGQRPPDHNSDAFQGYHRPYVLVILDEAGGIPAWMWTAVEAITSGDGCRIFAIGNPTDNSSQFARLRSNPVWHTMKVNTFDTPNFTGEIETFPAELREDARMTLPGINWVNDAKLQWGENSSLYRVRILGEFADSDDGLIPLSWISMANQRWFDWNDLGNPELVGHRIIGCDPAWLGEDMTAIAVRDADVIRSVTSYSKRDTVQTAELMRAELEFPASVGIVDVNGVGAGVYDQLRHGGYGITAFNGGSPTKRRDNSGKIGFPNLRSASWYGLRELLDPALNATLALPEDDGLMGDLTAPRYSPTTGGKIVVESKDDYRKRLGRSPDKGDAVAMACWLNPSLAKLERDPEGAPVKRPPKRPIRYSDQVQW